MSVKTPPEAARPKPPAPLVQGTLKFRFERFSRIAKEIAPLALAQWGEFPYKKKIELDIDWDRAFNLDLMGLLHVLTVRDGSRLVGYVINTVNSPIMHASSKWAFVEGLYLDVAYREGWNGYNIFKKNEKGMRMLGVDVIRLACPVGTFEVILKRLNYEFLELGAFKFL